MAEGIRPLRPRTMPLEFADGGELEARPVRSSRKRPVFIMQVFECRSLSGRVNGTTGEAGYPEGGSDAHSGFGDFDDRDGFDSGTGSGPDLRSGLSGLPAVGPLLRM